MSPVTSLTPASTMPVSATVASMTGFATVSGDGFSLVIKSVNHRFLDLQVRVPPACEELESVLRATVRGAVKRVHVEVSLQVEGGGTATSVKRNDTLLAAFVESFREAARMHGIAGEIDLNALLRMPGVMVSESSRVRIAADDVSLAAAELIDRFVAARLLEGAALASEMHAAMDRLLESTAEMTILREGVREAHLARLRGRLLELVEGVEIKDERLLAEAALLAERSDVEEELVRMRTHARQFQAILVGGGEVGKRLDFLLQEMNREANTMLSKGNAAMGERGLRLTEIGLTMKAEIERVKEQVQNVE